MKTLLSKKNVTKLIFLTEVSWLASACMSPADLGDKAFNRRQYGLAAQHYTEAQAEGINNYKINYNKGICYKELGKTDKAIDAFQAAINTNIPDTSDALYQHALLSTKVGAWNDVLKDCEKLQKINNKKLTNDTLYLQGQALYKLKRFDEAGDILEGVSTAYSKGSEKSLNTLAYLGECYYRNRQPQLAKRYFIDFYMGSKKSIGKRITDADYYLAGKIEYTNLNNAGRDHYWSKLSKKFKKDNNIK